MIPVVLFVALMFSCIVLSQTAGKLCNVYFKAPSLLDLGLGLWVKGICLTFQGLWFRVSDGFLQLGSGKWDWGVYGSSQRRGGG